MNTPNFENSCSATLQERYSRINYPEFHEYLKNHYPKELIWGERIYWYLHNLTDYPVCPECGSRVKFRNSKQGYYTFCSNRCQGKSPVTIEKKRQTSLKHYGVYTPMHDELVRERQRQTCRERYGVDNIRKSEIGKIRIKETMRTKYGVDYPMQSEEVREKSRNTLQQKYGVDHNSKRESDKQRKRDLFQDPNYINKIRTSYRKTCLERYGVECANQAPEVRERMTETMRKHYLEEHDNILGYTEEGYWKVKCPHPECNQCQEKWFISSSGTMGNRYRTGREVCTRILPIAESQNKNTSIELFIQNVLNEEKVEYRTNVRDIISPKELDIYVPDLNLGIECNGCFWHSTQNKEPEYHIDKYNMCQEKGIKLLSIWEDWLMSAEKREIVKSLIKTNLCLYDRVIDAANCEVRIIDTVTSNEFLQQNHIYGKCPCKFKLGLFYRDELVSVMSIVEDKKPISRKHKYLNGEYTITRFCNRNNVLVTGAQEKLLRYFIETYNPFKIMYVTYNDLGETLDLEGFIVTKESSESVTWFFESRSYKRQTRVIEDGIQIYDSGQTKWNLTWDDMV